MVVNGVIGIWGQRHKRYLKEYKNATYTTLLISGKLNSYLADINEQAEDMLYRSIKEMTEKENVTEQLKAENQMLWVQMMNSIRNRVEEVVNSEIIYS
ncbi:TnpV protein [Blautia sp. DFI.4.84]|nr:TnpV protein [Blautia sp. DFI.4.84]